MEHPRRRVGRKQPTSSPPGLRLLKSSALEPHSSITNMTRASAVFLVALFCSSLVAAAPVAEKQQTAVVAPPAPAAEIPVAAAAAAPHANAEAQQQPTAASVFSIPAALASIVVGEQSETHSPHVPEFVHAAEKARRRSFRRRHP
ncbi:hypothetical protein MKEN_00411400 [Mycena kentingensis (nom. inval.)]|nr:hypothetical protein MKEN_00411400 [Mycena kentingensis (nom. inval.)]